MSWLALAAALFLAPVLESDADVRFVSSGTNAVAVDWHVAGAYVGTTTDQDVLETFLPAGRSEVWATSEWSGSWRILARPDDAGGSGAAMVPGWTAFHDGVAPTKSSVSYWWAAVPAATALALIIGRRSKQP